MFTNNKFKKCLVFVFALLVVFLMVNVPIHAQTPANLPGTTPGTTTTSGDGGPIVPFDGGMSLVLVASGIAYVKSKMKKRIPALK